MTTDEIEEVIVFGFDPNGETAEVIIAKLRAADELVDHILTSESRNPELALAEAYHNIGKGETK